MTAPCVPAPSATINTRTAQGRQDRAGNLLDAAIAAGVDVGQRVAGRVINVGQFAHQVGAPIAIRVLEDHIIEMTDEDDADVS